MSAMIILLAIISALCQGRPSYADSPDAPDEGSRKSSAPDIRTERHVKALAAGRLYRPHSSRTTSATYGTWKTDCYTCHDLHGTSTGSNLSMIRQKLLYSTATTTVDFSAKPQGYAANASPWNGICEVCHTRTAYYRKDGGQRYDHGHTGQYCTTCHPHSDGFKPVGGSCLDCHNTPQGSRRAAGSEFSHIADNHAHLSAATGGVSDADCTVCHDQTTHRDGYVDLYDPDGGSNYRFATVSDLSSDPDLSDFCMNCHDSDGARRSSTPMNPFGSGNQPPNIAASFGGTATSSRMPGSQLRGYTKPNTHHDLSSSDQARSGGKVECTSCHNAHLSSQATTLANPDDLTQTMAYSTVGEKVAFCLACHDHQSTPQGVTQPPSMLDARGWMTETGNAWSNGNAKVHGGATMRGVGPSSPSAYGYLSTPGDRQIPLGVDGRTAVPPGGISLACDVCHDPHGSTYTDRSWNGNVYALRNVISSEYQQYDNGSEDGIGRWLWPQTPYIAPTSSYVTKVRQDPTDDTMTDFCRTCHSVGPMYHFWGLCFGCHTGHRKGWELRGSF
ncbi:MAG: hypothetical protein HYX75_16875 [Acidobacteria bacterium]|nr:hypothetical protein [Acidobacteriota bacterium]